VVFLIASLIVLALVPLYLPNKRLNDTNDNLAIATFDLVYGSDIVNGNSFNITDFKTLASDVSVISLPFLFPIFDASLVDETSSIDEYHRQQRSIYSTIDNKFD
jgi:hypothetical protein